MTRVNGDPFVIIEEVGPVCCVTALILRRAQSHDPITRQRPGGGRPAFDLFEHSRQEQINVTR